MTLPDQSDRFPEHLRMELARCGMTQRELADHLGYTQTAISYWASGKRQPSLRDLVTLADFFGTSTDYLLGRDPDRRGD